jgi:tRNA (guanine-N(7)-)-methyltransferase subunit TRM82
MKQLLSGHDDFFVVGLNDRAFVFRGRNLRKSSSSRPTLAEPQRLVSELLPQDPAETTNDGKDPAAQPQGDRKHQKTEHELKEVTAVAIHCRPATSSGVGDETRTVHCAVARGDKTLSLYSWNLGSGRIESAQGTAAETTNAASPSLVYSTPKRVSCLTYGKLPLDGRGSPKSPTELFPVLVSGDVAGDSYAYSLLELGQRLLLGHTASMLTGVAAIARNEDGSDQHLLTADRDEKIRVSRFPESYIIEGFLLGHTEYVTAMAAFSPSAPPPPPTHGHHQPKSLRAVSCGGDRTVRLWDLETFKELCCASSASSMSESSDEELDPALSKIPTDIAVDGSGQYVAVVFDESNELALFQIVKHDGTNRDPYSLRWTSSASCPSQPLAVLFYDSGTEGEATMMVLMRDPHYLMAYTIQRDHSMERSTEASVAASVCAVQTLAARENIVMPTSLLEKNQHGKPSLQKEIETRGPASADAPWNRVERVEIAKERSKKRRRRKKALPNEGA